VNRDELALEAAKEILRHGIKIPPDYKWEQRKKEIWTPIAMFSYEFADAMIEQSGIMEAQKP
jgi:hypothetical protein